MFKPCVVLNSNDRQYGMHQLSYSVLRAEALNLKPSTTLIFFLPDLDLCSQRDVLFAATLRRGGVPEGCNLLALILHHIPTKHILAQTNRKILPDLKWFVP